MKDTTDKILDIVDESTRRIKKMKAKTVTDCMWKDMFILQNLWFKRIFRALK